MKLSMKNVLRITMIAFTALLANYSAGQEHNVYTDMSLDEILDVDVVVTASKKPQDLFEAPLSVTIIKKDEILKSGATSMMEALRLSQGLIVRETTPGNYDVHIRGFDDFTKNAYVTLPFNTTILVMINNRIVYSYFSGGTFWETLPIDIHDIERIEIVRGPASALYGPNAATGVINIITSHAKEKGLNAYVNGSVGNTNTKSLNAHTGYNWDNKTKLTFSTNYLCRSRFNFDYYDWWNEEYVPYDSLNMMMTLEKNNETHELWEFNEYRDSINAHQDIEKSLEKMGANLFFHHKFSEKSNIDFSHGVQKSQCQKPAFLNFSTPLSHYNSYSIYVEFRAKIKNIYGQLNFNKGKDLSNYGQNSYTYKHGDLNLEYHLQLDKLSFRPGAGLKRFRYNSPITYDEPFDLQKLNCQFKDEPRIMNSFATFLLSEWKIYRNLNLTGGVRLDKFDINTNYLFNYEICGTFRPNKSNMLRFVHSKANRSPFIFDTYMNATMDFYGPVPFQENKAEVESYLSQNILARKDQKFPTNHTFELSWRGKPNPVINFDIELFASKLTNLVAATEYRELRAVYQLTAQYEIDSIKSANGKADMFFENLDLWAEQLGISFMVRLKPNQKTDFKLFGTIQKTRLSGKKEIEFTTLGRYFEHDTINNTLIMTEHSSANLTLWSEKLTPLLYGGFAVNYMPAKRLNFHLNSYISTKQNFGGMPFYNIVADYTGKLFYNYMAIKPYIIANAKISYDFTQHAKAYVSIRNLLGNHREFGFTDTIGTLYLLGIQWDLNKNYGQ